MILTFSRVYKNKKKPISKLLGGGGKCPPSTGDGTETCTTIAIKSICYPELFKFSTAAMSHGCKHEDVTILQYKEEMKVIHINFRVTKCKQ